MDESEENCPLTKKIFIKQLLETNPNYTEIELNELYAFFQKSKKGGKKNQKGGAKCADFHNVYRICCIFLLVSAGITCVTTQSGTYIVTHIIWIIKDMLDVRHFQHGFDIVGKTNLTLSFLERFTKFFLEIREKGITPTWLKNIFEIFCQVESNDKTLEEAKQQITNVILTEAIENEKKYSLSMEGATIGNNNLTYTGSQIKIKIGDAVVTISHDNQDEPSYPLTQTKIKREGGKIHNKKTKIKNNKKTKIKNNKKTKIRNIKKTKRK